MSIWNRFQRLSKIVRRELLPALAEQNLAITHEEEQAAGDDAVEVEGGELRLRLQRDRGDVLVALGSIHDRNTWFDLDVVTENFGIEVSPVRDSRDPSQVIAQLVKLLKSSWRELTLRFDANHFQRTIEELAAFRDARTAARIQGSEPR